MSTWKEELKASLKENVEKIGVSATYASLATVTLDNKPAVRTVVMRDFAGEHYSYNTGWNSDVLVVVTDKRSEKMNELRHNPNVEVNWYMNGTMEQYRIVGTVDIIEKDFDSEKLEHLNSHFEKVELDSDNSNKSLALQMFLQHEKSASSTDKFNWQAERLRQFHQFGPHMRKQMTTQLEDILDIDEMDPENGWFKNDHAQELLEEAFENFVLLVITVTSVRHWAPCTGTKIIL